MPSHAIQPHVSHNSEYYTKTLKVPVSHFFLFNPHTKCSGKISLETTVSVFEKLITAAKAGIYTIYHEEIA